MQYARLYVYDHRHTRSADSSASALQVSRRDRTVGSRVTFAQCAKQAEIKTAGLNAFLFADIYAREELAARNNLASPHTIVISRG